MLLPLHLETMITKNIKGHALETLDSIRDSKSLQRHSISLKALNFLNHSTSYSRALEILNHYRDILYHEEYSKTF